MLGDTLKAIRKEKGITQEELAIKLHVVRQTVSKWEKGVSIPDADSLQQIADVFEVTVQELLGGDIQKDASRNEVADQLARLNEHLAVRNRRTLKIWRGVGVLALALVIGLLCFIAFAKKETKNTVTSIPELPEVVTISENVTVENYEEFKISFVPNISDKSLEYHVSIMENGVEEASECKVEFQNGICTATHDLLIDGCEYTVVFSVSNGQQERNTVILSHLICNDGGLSYQRD